MLRLYLVLFLILTLMGNQSNCQEKTSTPYSQFTQSRTAESKKWYMRPYNTSCFIFVTEIKLNWTNARSWCERREAYLASIRNKDEQLFIRDKLPGANTQEFWIGLNDIKKESDFQWVDGTPYKFNYWLGVQPSGGRKENCVELYIDKFSSNTKAKWNDKECSEEQSFICRKKEKKTTTPSSQSTQSTTAEKTSTPSSQSTQSTTTETITTATATTACPKLVWISCMSLFIIALS